MNQNSLKNLESLTPEKAKQIGKIGGIESGKAKRERKAIKEYINVALNANVQTADSINLLNHFLPEISKDEQNILLLSVVKTVKELVSDDIKPLERVKILEFLRDSIGEKPVEQLKIDEERAEEFEIDKKLAQLSTEELAEMLYDRHTKK